jgi:hypothetical protein
LKAGLWFGVFASSSHLLFGSNAGRLQAETPLNSLCKFAEPPLFAKMRRIMTLNCVEEVNADIVQAARDSLVIGSGN